MYSLLRFLKHEPWDQFRWWKKLISDPYKQLQQQQTQTQVPPVQIQKQQIQKDGKLVAVVKEEVVVKGDEGRDVKVLPVGNSAVTSVKSSIPVGTPSIPSSASSSCFIVLRSVLNDIMLRRTKSMKDRNGHFIVALPSKTVHMIMIDLSEPEREFYDTLLLRSKIVVKGN